jgi:catechol 2,3-dioxygenase-like lactoylglutathione lyase family enzyme
MQFNFDCMFYYVSDLGDAIDFYSDILGLKLISRDIVARFDIDGVLFELVPTTDKTKISGMGNARLCLRVDNIRSAIEELRERGIQTGRIQAVDNGLLAAIEDPDGNEICLWQDT